VPAEDAPVLAAGIESLKNAGGMVDLTVRARSADGEPQGLEIRLRTLTVSTGAASDLVALSRVVTERERTQAALRRSEASFSRALDYSPIAVAISAPDGALWRVKDSFCSLTKRSATSSPASS
jgi:PAS domain-containing protein